MSSIRTLIANVIRGPLHAVGLDIVRVSAAEKEQERYGNIYEKYRDSTMITKGTYVKNLALIASRKTVPGCIVECGVWKGGMSAGIAELFGPDRKYFLFDSFEGLPPVQPEDGEDAAAWQRDTESPLYFNNCSAAEADARQSMERSPAKDFTLIKGWFNDTIPKFVPPTKIAVLRLDGDWYESTKTCLTSLFPHVHEKGLVVIDDYVAWSGCARAVHEFLAGHPEVRLLQFENDVTYLSWK